jgi:biotin operon repressor
MYRRSTEIEKRLNNMVHLIQGGNYGTPNLASALGISRPTVSRCLAALRERGYVIRSIKTSEGWIYQIASEPPLEDPFGNKGAL